MNIHPIFVHFPIALLTIYALLELARFKPIRNLPYLFDIKAFLVIVGFFSALVTVQTGNLAGEGVPSGPIRNLVETHSFFANISVYIFGLIALVYFLKWIDLSSADRYIIASPFGKIWIAVKKQTGYILRSPLLPFIALAGLLSITITGALGGAIVYGPDVDPFVHFIYGLFF